MEKHKARAVLLSEHRDAAITVEVGNVSDL